MNQSEIAALMKGIAPVIRDLVAASMRPLADEIVSLRAEIADLRGIDHSAMIVAAVETAVAALPPAPAGKDGAPGRDGLDGAPGKDGAPGLDGRDGVDGKDGADGAAGRDGAPGRDGADGKSVDMEDVRAVLKEMVDGAVQSIPVPRDGRDGADGAPGQDGAPGKDGERGRDGVDGERGPEGPPGKLPLVKVWAAGSVTYEAEIRSHAGATYQALRDTGTEPGGDDWICLAARGTDGKDADQIEVRGTFDPTSAYRRLNIVALNGAAFMARTDNPGSCPGNGWQMIAMQGKAGKPGERGMQGLPGKGEKGDAGDAVVALSVSDQGLLVLVNGDGSTVECDLYPLLSRIGG